MPSVILGNPALSGAQCIISGCFWSGQNPIPIGGVQLCLAGAASGNVYISFSGNMTLNSGGMLLSGGGLQDGMIMSPGTSFFIPRMSTGQSGTIQIFARHDAACSGQARLYWMAF